MIRPTAGARMVAVATVVALLGVVGASAASAAPPAGVSMKGTGKPPPGVGLFSSATLHAEDLREERPDDVLLRGGRPWCVNPWPAGMNNGGATAQGVTATKVNVIAYLPNTQMLGPPSGNGPQNQATKEPAPLEDVMEDWQAAYQYAAEKVGAFQLWGRTVALDLVTASGPDETCQRQTAGSRWIAKEAVHGRRHDRDFHGGRQGVLHSRGPRQDRDGKPIHHRGERNRADAVPVGFRRRPE